MEDYVEGGPGFNAKFPAPIQLLLLSASVSGAACAPPAAFPNVWGRSRTDQK